MSEISKIQERIDRDLYTVSVFGSSEALYEQMYDDIESLLILFRAKNRAIEHRIEVIEDRIKFINSSDSVFKGSMSASKELHRLRGIKKELKRLL